MRNLGNHPSRRGLITMAVIAGLATTLTCVCGLAALFLLRRAGSLPPLVSSWQPAAPTPAPTSTAQPGLATPTKAPTQTLATTATPANTPTPASTPALDASATPVPTHTRPPTSTTVPTLMPTIAASPTPFVCQDIADLSAMTLAPGQRFECTVREETFNTLANSYPESPCSQTRITLDNGEIQVECRMGVTMSAAIEAKAQDCRIALRVLRGTLGFKGIVQDLIKTQFNAIRYDKVCVEQVNVDDGQAYVAGKGR